MRNSKRDTLGSFVAMVFLAGSFTVSCSRLLAPSDAAITKDIKAKMFSDTLLKNSSINVATHGHVVILTGRFRAFGCLQHRYS